VYGHNVKIIAISEIYKVSVNDFFVSESQITQSLSQSVRL
jgi:peroxiredoxin